MAQLASNALFDQLQLTSSHLSAPPPYADTAMHRA